MDLELAIILGFVAGLLGWILWDALAPLIGDHEYRRPE